MNCPNCQCEAKEHEIFIPGFNETPVFLCQKCCRQGRSYPCAILVDSEIAKSMELKVESEAQSL